MRKKSGIDWSKTPCCGAGAKRVAGLTVCSTCGRQVNVQEPRRPASTWDRHDREYREESTLPEPRRLDDEL